MVLTGAEIVVACLKEQGVDTVFGYPGGAILNIYDALYKHADEIRHILTSHEQGASHAADGYARATGKVGVCIATSGPGATNLVTGIATAYMDSIPMVAITCNVGTSLLGKDSFQEIDIAGVVMPITKYSFIVKDVRDLAKVIRRAFSIAKSGRPGPVLVDITKDATANTTEYIQQVPDVILPDTAAITDEDLNTAAELIKEAKRPMIFVGGGAIAADASEELLEFAEKINAPVCDTLMGKGAFSGEHPLYAGMLGMHGTKYANFGVTHCDLLIAIGTRFSDRVFGNAAKFAQNAKVLQIDVDPAEIDKNIRTTASVIGDVKEVLKRLLEEIPKKEHPEWIAHIQELKEKYAEADGFRQKYEAGYFEGNITPRWIGNTHFCWYAVKTPAGTDFILVNAGKRQKQPAFDQKAMAKALTAELGRKVEPGKMPFREIAFSDDLKQLTFVTEGMKYTYDRNKNKMIGKVKEEPRHREGHWGGVNEENWQGATPSPDGKKEAFVSEGNLFVRDISSGKVNRLSYDGAPGEYYSSFISWSPDSRKLVSCKYRPAWIRKLKTVVSSPAGQLQPEMEEIDYVKPGDALPVKRPVLFLVEEGRQVNIEFAEPEKQFNLNNIRWADDSRSFTFDYNKRGHQEYIVYKVTGDNPKAQVLIGEKMPTFVYYNLLYRYDLKDRNEILWISERDGWRHLYLYDADNGQVKRQLTKGEWVVKRVLHVDDAARVVYLVGCGKDAGEDPYLEKVYRLNIENGELLCLTPENGNHQVEFSRDYTYFTDSWSRIDCPPVAALRSAKDGSVLLSLEKADISKMLAEGWRMPASC